MIIPNLIYSKTQKKSHAYMLVPCQENTQRNAHKRKGNAKKCVCKYTQNQILITQV